MEDNACVNKADLENKKDNLKIKNVITEFK